MEEKKCEMCGETINDNEYEITFNRILETHCFCEKCFKDIYNYATGWTLVKI